MSNTLNAVVPLLLAGGLKALRQNAIMPMLVNRAYETEAGRRGQTVQVPIPSAIAVQDVAPGPIPPATGDVAPTSVQIPLQNWKEAAFYLTDKEQLEIMDGVIPMQATEAVKSIANQVDADILGLYKSVYGFSGTPGTTPFATDISAATAARTVLSNQLAPNDPRAFVMNPDAEGNALGLRQFQDLMFNANGQDILDGKLTRKLGFSWHMDQNVVTHIAGVPGGALKFNAATGAGFTAAVVTAGAAGGTLVAGDIFTIAGLSQTFVVSASVILDGTGTGNLTFMPPLPVNVPANAAITVKPSHVVNLAFHRDAFAFASRPLESSAQGLGAVSQPAIDPVSGLTLRMEVTREHKRTRFAYDILYGVACLRPQLAVRVAG